MIIYLNTVPLEIIAIIEKSASLLAMDEQGRIYFHRSAELWRDDPKKK